MQWKDQIDTQNMRHKQTALQITEYPPNISNEKMFEFLEQMAFGSKNIEFVSVYCSVSYCISIEPVMWQGP